MTPKTETTVKPAKRLLGRIVARELTPQETEAASGGAAAARVLAMAHDTCSDCRPDDCGL